MTTPQLPVWGADVPVSMPVPSGDDIQVPMNGFGFSQYRLVHDITAADAEQMAAPPFAPPSYGPATEVRGDADLDDDPRSGPVDSIGSA